MFDAANSVRAIALLDPRLLRWSNPEAIELYKRFDEDPNFEAIVQRVRDAKGLRPTDEETLNLIAQLTQDIAVEYLIEKAIIEEPK